MKNGLFITVEGLDGSGKSTQINLLNKYLIRCKYNVILTREPGGTAISEKIRKILLDSDNINMSSITEMLLYASSRAQLIAEVVEPSVRAGKIVICDRFLDSSLVYQGFGRGIETDVVESVNKIAVNGVNPDITFFFDVNPEEALKRIPQKIADRIEKENFEFHKRVYNGYKMLASMYPQRIKTIDSTKPVNEIFSKVKCYIEKLLV